jgi:hypothetical protein
MEVQESKHQVRTNGSISPTNRWLSFAGHLNEQEEELQNRALNQLFDKYPGLRMQTNQREQIFRQLALLNAQYQFAESRKTPATFIPHTITLNLLGSGEGGQAVDQILPANPARLSMTLLAGNTTAFIASTHLQSLPNFGTPLVRVPYFELPMGTRWPVESTGPLFAIGSSTSTVCYLTVIEEVYKIPTKLSKLWAIANKEERHLINHHWIEGLLEDL